MKVKSSLEKRLVALYLISLIFPFALCAYIVVDNNLDPLEVLTLLLVFLLPVSVLFFKSFKSVGSWTFNDMISLMTIVSGSYGLSKVLFGGTKDLAKSIMAGNLDSFMTQPQNVLLYAISAKSHAKGWGHIMTAVILMFIGGETTLYNFPLLLLLIAGGCCVFSAFGIIISSLAFWLGAIDSVSRKLIDALFLFVGYPVNIYSGAVQFMMFTLIPAGVIGYLPVELLREFSWRYLCIFLGSVACFIYLACFVFYKGLKKYESGNQFNPQV